MASWPSMGLWGQVLRVPLLAPSSIYYYQVQTAILQDANVLQFPEHFHSGQQGRTPEQDSLGDF